MKTWQEHIEAAETVLERAVGPNVPAEYMDSLVNLADTHKGIAQVILWATEEREETP